jgi:DNA (cytosine-5)-methyltransferase 1
MRVGSLFSGYGGLDMAVGGDLAWYAEMEPAACKVMAAHHPGVPNLGDVTRVDWSRVERVDVITAGYPCQPFSNAGNRKGKDDERHLWPYVRDAIGALGPPHVVLENVRGHLTLGFADVLADLADLGMSARWGVVRASDAGACHSRARLFVIADAERQGLQGKPERSMEYAGKPAARHQGTADAASGSRTQSDDFSARGTAEPGERASAAADPSGERYGSRQGAAGMGGMVSAAKGSRWPASTAWQEPGTGSAAHDRHADGGDDAQKQAWHGKGTKPEGVGRNGEQGNQTWGAYEPAIRRWSDTIGRPAPAPTVRRADRDRLSPLFVEWMMGLPEGWVTGHGLSPSQELKMLGNGVVPQQAALALRLLGAA